MEEVVAANQAKSQFLAAMSHELRTPLNAILGFSEVIRDQSVGPLVSSTYRGYASDIHNAGSHLLAIVSDILDMARIEANVLRFETGPVSAATILDEVARVVQQRADEGGVALRVVGPDMIVCADQDKLRQALLNVAHNAVKFTPPGGSVTLSAERTGTMARLSITDSGIGIAAADITAALTPFRQIAGVMHRKYEGAGLGLPLAKRYVEVQGGSLELVSELGRGTVVTVMLPLAEAPPIAEEPFDAPPPRPPLMHPRAVRHGILARARRLTEPAPLIARRIVVVWRIGVAVARPVIGRRIGRVNRLAETAADHRAERRPRADRRKIARAGTDLRADQGPEPRPGKAAAERVRARGRRRLDHHAAGEGESGERQGEIPHVPTS
jgi:anti-sigma regulatory factor (Ser/Thr protein kinase)